MILLLGRFGNAGVVPKGHRIELCIRQADNEQEEGVDQDVLDPAGRLTNASQAVDFIWPMASAPVECSLHNRKSHKLFPCTNSFTIPPGMTVNAAVAKFEVEKQQWLASSGLGAGLGGLVNGQSTPTYHIFLRWLPSTATTAESTLRVGREAGDDVEGPSAQLSPVIGSTADSAEAIELLLTKVIMVSGADEAVSTCSTGGS